VQWYEDEDFWREMYPYMFPAEKFGAAEEQISQILSLTGMEKGAVLDLCCGPGRHALEFSRRGYRVTGVDGIKFLLDRAKERAAESGEQVEWIHKDMREFAKPNAFDLAVNLWTSFGFFENETDDLRVLSNIFESLRPGGLFVIDLLGKEIMARLPSLTRSTEYPDGSLLVERRKICDGWSRVANEWILIKEAGARRFYFELTTYSGRELRERLFAAGFADVKLFGDLAGRPYDWEATRLIAMATRPGSE
jgi:SAM-dependent methyltransferase